MRYVIVLLCLLLAHVPACAQGCYGYTGNYGNGNGVSNGAPQLYGNGNGNGAANGGSYGVPKNGAAQPQFCPPGCLPGCLPGCCEVIEEVSFRGGPPRRRILVLMAINGRLELVPVQPMTVYAPVLRAQAAPPPWRPAPRPPIIAEQRRGGISIGGGVNIGGGR